MTVDPTPGPAFEPAQDGGAADLLSEEERKLRRRKGRILATLLAVLAVIIAILIFRACAGHAPIPGILAPKLPHYAFSIYGPKRPLGVAVSPSGDRIYVTESDGSRLVRVYDRGGSQVDTLKPPGTTTPQRNPVYVAVDPISGGVFVSDRLRRTVDTYSPEGKYLGKFRLLGPSGSRGRAKKVRANPLGLAFDKQGNVHMTDVRGRFHRVLVFGRDGKLVRKTGTRRQFSFPNGIAVDARGNSYVSDSNHGRLVIFNQAAKIVAQIRRGVGEGDLGLPRGVALDTHNRLYVVDTADQTVKVYRVNTEKPAVPTTIGSFGQEGLGNGMFEYPNGVATDGSGRIYVTDRENERVQVWTY